MAKPASAAARVAAAPSSSGCAGPTAMIPGGTAMRRSAAITAAVSCPAMQMGGSKPRAQAADQSRVSHQQSPQSRGAMLAFCG
ncbi:hypothetical protein ACFQY5_26435 [Paeniroseomonas aquatica]|uniref:hypothetical protein n=1 Tax=Paeniroseomonas aquatica TaxID=373043 RepID=UPI00360C319F